MRHTLIDRFFVYATLEYVCNIYHTSRNLSIADTARDPNLKAAFITRSNNEPRRIIGRSTSDNDSEDRE